MRIGVIQRSGEPLSFARYREEIVARLGEQGEECVPVRDDRTPATSLDLLWDPGLLLRRPPRALREARLPVVATIHGLMDFALSPRESMRGLRALVPQGYKTARLLGGWRALRAQVRRVITVSAYGADEVGGALGIDPANLRPIHHGVDHSVFRPDGPRAAATGGYFLVVSQYQPKKNVDRVLAAWSGLARDRRPPLVAVVPGYPAASRPPEGVDLRRDPCDPAALAELYRGALALVAPSLHETFGMPLAEAMACGCPVITSNTTACPEITGDAALHVDPRSIESIRGAISVLVGDTLLRSRLRERGLARAASYTWEASARAHAAVFAEALAVATAEVRA